MVARSAAGRRRLPDSARLRWLAGIAMLVPLLAVLPQVAAAEPGPAPPPGAREVLNDVHTDAISIDLAGGQLRLRTRVGFEPFRFLAPPGVIFQLPDSDTARLAVPEDPQFAFLGPPGTTVWVAPERMIEGLLFAGWETERILPGQLQGDALDISLVDVAGPGRLEMFGLRSDFSVLRQFSSTDPAHRTLRQQVNSHVHSNWAFFALGRYQLTFEVRANAPDGTPLAPVRATYTWHVGGTQAGDVAGEPTATTLSAAPTTPGVGDPVTLTASVSSPSALAPAGFVDFLDGSTVLGHAAVTAGTATLTTNALAGGQHQITARFVPRFGNDHASSTSPPVTVDVQGTGTPSLSPTPSASASPSPTPSIPLPTPSPSRSASAGPVPSPTPSRTSPSPTPSCSPVTRTVTSTTSTSDVILDNGHVDYAVRLLNGQLTSQVKDGTVPGRTTWRDPSSVVFHLRPASAGAVPASGFSFLGSPGARIWQIPQSQRQGILWLGWNTEEIPAAQVRGGITWSLDRVDGPGALAIYLLDTFGRPDIVFNSRDGLPDREQVSLGTHAHGNWAFTAQGVYRLTFRHSATLANGRAVSDTAVVTIAVGDTDPRPLARQTSRSTRTVTGMLCDGQLVLTGFSLVGPLLLGTGLLAGGVLLVVATHRRRRATATA